MGSGQVLRYSDEPGYWVQFVNEIILAMGLFVAVQEECPEDQFSCNFRSLVAEYSELIVSRSNGRLAQLAKNIITSDTEGRT